MLQLHPQGQCQLEGLRTRQRGFHQSLLALPPACGEWLAADLPLVQLEQVALGLGLGGAWL